MGQKLHFSRQHRDCGTQNVCLSKITPFCLGIFHIQLPREGIWDKNCIFEDNIEIWVVETLISDPLLSWNFSNPTTLRGDMGQKLHFSI